MAKLEIRVTGLDQLRSAAGSSALGAGPDLSRQLRVQGQLAERLARSLRTSLDGIGASLSKEFSLATREAEQSAREAAEQQQRLRRQAEQDVLKQARAQQAQARQAQQDAIRNAQAQQRIDLQAEKVRLDTEQKVLDRALRAVSVRAQAEAAIARQRLGEADLLFRREEANLRRLERERSRALRDRTRQEQEAARRTAAIIAASGRATAAGGRGIGGALSGVGSGLGGGISSLFSGGFGLSGLVSGAGRLGSGLVGGLGSAASGLAGGVGGAFSSGLSLVPKVGPLLSGISSGVTSAVQGGLQAAASVGSGVLSAATDLASSITSKLVTTIQVGLVAGLALAFTSVGKAADFQRIENAFDGIARSIGTDATSALDGFREATRGTVSDLDLLTQANRAVILGAVSSQQEFEKLSSTAIQLGRATGRDAKDALEDLTLGIARQSKLILDNLGIIVDAEAAYQRYATSIGKTVFELSDLEKRQAFSTAAFQSAERAIVAIGKPQADFAETLEQLGASFENLQVSIGAGFLPILTEITPELTRITDGSRTWLTDNSVEIAGKLSSALQGIPTVLGRIADFISGNSLSSALEAGEVAIEALLSSADQALKGLGATVRGEIRAAIEAAEFAIGDAGSNSLRRVGDVAVNAASRGPAALVDLVLGTTPNTFGSRDSSAAANAAIDAERARASAEAAQALQGAVSPIEAFTRGLQAANEQLNVRSAVPTALIRQELPPAAPRPSLLTGNEAVGLPGVREAFPARIDQIGREKVVRESLERLSINIAEFGQLGEELVQAIADSSDRTRAIREEASARLTSEVREDYAERLEDARDAREFNREASAELLREREQAKEEELDALEASRELLRDLSRERNAALATFREEIAEARAESDRRAREATGQRFNELAGFAGGLEGVSLPLNVFKAIEKVRREDSKRVFDELRLATQGLSSNDLAANGGARLREVLTTQASRDVDAPGIRSTVFAELEAESAKRLARAEEELALRAKEAGEKLSATLLRTGEVILSTAEQLRELADEAVELDKRLSEAERLLRDFRRVERLARS